MSKTLKTFGQIWSGSLHYKLFYASSSKTRYLNFSQSFMGLSILSLIALFLSLAFKIKSYKQKKIIF